MLMPIAFSTFSRIFFKPTPWAGAVIGTGLMIGYGVVLYFLIVSDMAT